MRYAWVGQRGAGRAWKIFQSPILLIGIFQIGAFQNLSMLMQMIDSQWKYYNSIPKEIRLEFNGPGAYRQTQFVIHCKYFITQFTAEPCPGFLIGKGRFDFFTADF